MAGPILKIHAVPSGFVGIDQVLHKQSSAATDIVYGTSTLLPIEEAIDSSNTGNPGYNEPDPRYKIKLTNTTGQDYYPQQVGLSGKLWFTGHIGYEPRIFLKRNALYYNNELWEYDYVPKLNTNGEANYQLLASGVRFTSTYVAENPTALNSDVYATFFYWENQSYVHPVTSNVRGYFASANDDYVAFAPHTVLLNGSTDVAASGEFFTDPGIFRWVAAPSGANLSLGGYHHTWQRLTNDDLNDLLLNPGESVPAQIASQPFLVKDFTQSGPWYRYADIKISNESPDSALEKFFVQPVLRGKLNNQGYIYEGWSGYLDPTRPWDTHEGQADETVGYNGLFANTGGVCTLLMWEADWCWASGVNPFTINPALPSGIDTSAHYNTRCKFPAPCSGADVPPIITYYRSTKRTPDGRYAFAYSKDVVSGYNNESWLTQLPQNAEFKILESGSFATDAFPIPDSVYVRMAYTLRNFEYSATTGAPNYQNLSAWGSNPQFLNVQESDGLKAWTLEVIGTYYEQ